MLKMKMMTFFKNPVVKDIFIVLMAIIIAVSIISIPVSKAGSQISVAFRAASMGVSAGTKDVLIPELTPGQADYTNKKNKYSNIFCIDEGTHLDNDTYTNEYNAYSGEEVKNYFKNYNQAIWLIDNMYIANAGNSEVGLDYLAELVTSPQVAKNVSQYGTISADSIRALNKTVGGKKDAFGNVMNKNFIEVIEQLVLWNYTKNSENINVDVMVNGGFSGSNISSADQNAAKYLYHALKFLASNKTEYKSGGSNSNVVGFNTSKATIDIESGKVGPYQIVAQGVALNLDSKLKSKISATITKVDGSTVTLDSSKMIIENDGSFYFDIRDCGQITKSEVKVGDIFTGNKVTAEVITNGRTQNLLNVRKTYNTKPLSDVKEISYSGNYTIKVIKTKADGTTAIAENPATFTISGAADKKEATTNNEGVLTIVDNKAIKDPSATETYTIVEDKAPNGYVKYDGTITLNVGFKTEGTNYLLDKEKVNLTSTGTNGKARLDVKNNTIEIYVPNKEQERKAPDVFDLSLRKFITKVDGTAVQVSRVPVINNESKTILDLAGTAAYHHTKKSVVVKVGSEVEYTIRIYNEGKVDGVAREITDYIPTGLTFVRIADESASMYSTDANASSKAIVIKYNGSDVIKADSITRILNNETTNVYQEVKLICKVNDGYTGYITSRAEITNYGYTDSEGNWHEAKAIGNSDRDSVEKTIGNSLNLNIWYENAKTYVYTVDGATKEVTDYYPGVQDDDDFETVEVEKIEGDFRVLLRKVDKDDTNKGLAGAIFTFSDGKTTAASNVGGYIDLIPEQKITSNGQSFTYTFAETTAPAGYDKLEGNITLNVATKLENGAYVVDVENTKLANANENVSIDSTKKIISITVKDKKTVSNFDLALRKFITNVNGQEITSRIPQVTLTDDFKAGKATTAKYEHTKEPVEVATDNVVVYTIRVYNEGDVDGYAKKVMDDIPDGLEYLPNNEVNKSNAWKMYVEASAETAGSIKYNNKIYVPTEDATKADLIVTEALKDQLIKAYDAKTSTTLDYKDVKVAFRVVEPNSSDRIITNYAQITEHADKDGKVTVVDRDSVPNVWNEGEDDQDIEKIKLIEKKFDLSLRKFITNVNGKEITSRIPQVKITDDFKSGKVSTATYEHSKDPVDVVEGNTVVYTIRVYNEGEVDGYAKKVMDDIPNGLEFLPTNEINKVNAWKMYVEASAETAGSIKYNNKIYVPTEDAKKADLIVTDALKDQLIKAYDAKTSVTLDYRDVKVAFKVVEPNTSDRIIINYAQITEHADKNGKVTVVDRDSTPNVWNEGEDDQDIEKIRLRYFDLSLRKWVTEAIITENGQTTVTPTGHKAEDDPEAIVKVDLKKSKLNDVTVKFRYSIRVTNEGEIAGYAKEVKDYIPAGLKFDANDNSGWSTTEDPNVVTTDALADVLLKPGESAEVTIVLTWINNANNMGVKVNTAEISKDYNEYGAKDIDSTPNNKVPGEDDIDDAPVMLSVKTGSEAIGYVSLAGLFLSIVGVGAYVVKRRIV